jgi:alpha-galactosidase
MRYKEYSDSLSKGETEYIYKHLITYIKKLLFEIIKLDFEHVDAFKLLDKYLDYELYSSIKGHITKKKKLG